MMTRDEALKQLRDLQGPEDPEEAHIRADEILLALIDDDEIAAAFWAFDKWYS